MIFFFGYNLKNNPQENFYYGITNEGQILQTSGYFNLTGTRIDIDGSSGWFTASSNDWCNGSGTSNDPYIIKNVIIDGLYSEYNCIRIRNSGVFFEIRNCILYNSGTSGTSSGIRLDSVDNGLLINNTINNCYYGISMVFSDNNNLTDNILNGNFYGIVPHYGVNLRIINNTIEDSSNGIYGYDLSSTIFKENKMNNCGILLRGDLGHYNSISLDKTNLISGKPVYYYTNKIGLTPNNFSNAGQVILVNCNDSLISNLELSRGAIGIYAFKSYNNTISNNTMTENTHNGIWLDSSNTNRILNNSISKTKGHDPLYDLSGGILLFEKSSYNNFSGNNIYNNSNYGIYLPTGCKGNLLYLNNFSWNLNQARDYTNSIWYKDFIGNFWSNYQGKDVNDDGIGDTPHDLPPAGGSVDNYPIWWDAPMISITSPTVDTFEHNPFFEISIDEGISDTSWYSLDDGLTNITLTGLTGNIDETAWYSALDGPIDIIFYVNDSRGYIGQAEVQVIKELSAPDIIFVTPTVNEEFGSTPPDFSITIDDLSPIVARWYTIDNGVNTFNFTGLSTTIDANAWNNAPQGVINLIVYAMDDLGQIGIESITIVKTVPAQPPEIAGYDIFILIGAIAVITLFILIKRKE